jgi:hypothetical protein
MISEALIQTIVRNIVQRLQDDGSGVAAPVTPDSTASAAHLPKPVEDLYQSYRARYLHVAPSEERFSVEFDSSLPVELGRPLVCLYEKHQPCDSCGRCEVRGF